MILEAEMIMKIHVKCEPGLEIKKNLEGYLRVIPIVGGTFEGKIKGSVISGGADWNTEKEGGVSSVIAKYVLKTEDGAYIGIENSGMIYWEDNAKIKTVPRFTACQDGPYAWLNSGVYVGGLEVVRENEVEITVYKML